MYKDDRIRSQEIKIAQLRYRLLRKLRKNTHYDYGLVKEITKTTE